MSSSTDSRGSLSVVAISDTHNQHDQLVGDFAIPDADVLVHTGDFTNSGEVDEIRGFDEFLGGLPHRYKIVIAGNHDLLFDRRPETARPLLTNCTYLEGDEITIDGIRFYGAPWQPEFMNLAFNLPRGEPLRRVWAKMPNEIDVLLTHTPPAGVLDTLIDGSSAGCEELAAAGDRIRPRFHVFGHIHECSGVLVRNGTTYVNAAICDPFYRVTNPPRRFEVVLDAVTNSPPKA